MGIAASITVIGHKRERNRKHWTANFLQRRNEKQSILEGVRMYSGAPVRNFTSMTASDFELLLQLIGPSIKMHDSNMREGIPISKRLAVTLRFSPLHISVICASNINRHTRSVPGYHKVTRRMCEGN
jgi:hypothetical protein